VLIVDHHPLARLGLQRFLEEREHLVIVGEAADGPQALFKARELSPHVVLLGLGLAKLDGLAVTQILRREKPEVKVLVLMAQSQPELWLRIIRCGAHGFISKEASADQLVQAINAIAKGGKYFGDSTTAESGGATQADLGANKLNPREREVLLGVVDGLTNKQIAVRLGLSLRSVHTHRDRIKRKLNLHNVPDLTRFAIREGLISA